MFGKPNSDPKLDEAIDSIYSDLAGFTSETEEYGRMTDQLTKLYAIKNERNSRRVSPDTAVVVGANIAGILLILNHERLGIVTSKALGFVIRVR